MGRHTFKNPPVVHHAGSKAQRIEVFISHFIQTHRGTPSMIASEATMALGFPVSRQDVYHALVNLRVVRKTYALIPGLSVPEERRQYLLDMAMLASRASQILFIDEKKFKETEFHFRFSSVGYAAPGVRLQPGYIFSFFF